MGKNNHENYISNSTTQNNILTLLRNWIENKLGKSQLKADFLFLFEIGKSMKIVTNR